jgi:hypothetical protein
MNLKMSSHASFDPYEFDSYFFGNITREESEAILLLCDVGTFLLRCSTTQAHGYSLSVRDSLEGPRQVHHYLIASVEGSDGKRRLQMHDRNYHDIASLVAYYKMNKLEHTNLKMPAPKKALKTVIAEHKFDGQNVTDLSFERNDVLEILREPEEGWWVARNALGMIGFVPSNYVREENSGTEPTSNPSTRKNLLKERNRRSAYRKNNEDHLNLTIPAIVRVIANRKPSVYDKDAMTLKIGQTILLTKVLTTGICYGTNRETGVQGSFPFTYVKWTGQPIEDEEKEIQSLENAL